MRVTFQGGKEHFQRFLGSHTTNKNKMSHCYPTPSIFALHCHGNICHGTNSWLLDPPQVLGRHLLADLQSPRLVPLLEVPKRDPSRNREMGRVQALGGCQSFKKCINKPKDSVGGGKGCLRRGCNGKEGGRQATMIRGW
jgi:hypothetical protein